MFVFSLFLLICLNPGLYLDLLVLDLLNSPGILKTLQTANPRDPPVEDLVKKAVAIDPGFSTVKLFSETACSVY